MEKSKDGVMVEDDGMGIGVLGTHLCCPSYISGMAAKHGGVLCV